MYLIIKQIDQKKPRLLSYETMYQLAILIISFVIIIILWLNRKLNYWNNRNVPNTNPITPFGDLINCIFYKKNLYVLFKEYGAYFKKNGHKYFGLYLTIHPVFVPIDYELIKRLLTQDHDYIPDRGVYFDRKKVPLGENIITCTAARWKQLRAVASAGVSSVKMKKMAPIFDHYSNTLCEIIDDNGNGKPLKIEDLIFRYTIDVACHVLFGIEGNVLRNEISPILDVCRHGQKTKLINMLRVFVTDGFKNPLNLIKAFYVDNDVCKFAFDFSKELYEMRKKSDTKRDDLLTTLIDTYEKNDEDFDFALFTAQLTILLGASIGTTTTAMTYTLYQLATMKDYQEKIRNEIREAVSKNQDKSVARFVGELDLLKRFTNGKQFVLSLYQLLRV